MGLKFCENFSFIWELLGFYPEIKRNKRVDSLTKNLWNQKQKTRIKRRIKSKQWNAKKNVLRRASFSEI